MAEGVQGMCAFSRKFSKLDVGMSDHNAAESVASLQRNE